MELKVETIKHLHITKLLGCAAVLLFSILITLYEYDQIPRPVSALFIPLHIAVLSVPVSLHLVLCDFSRTLRKFSTFVLLISVYASAISMIVFLLLIAFKLDTIIGASWSVVFIPLWCGLFCYLLLCAFLCPGLISPQNNLKRYAFVIFVYFFAIAGASAAIVVKLDRDQPDYWLACLAPLWAGLLLHCISFALFELKPETKECFTAEKVFLVYASFQLLLVNMYLDLSDIPLWLACLPFWLSLGVWVFYIETESFKQTHEQDPLLQRQREA